MLIVASCVKGYGLEVETMEKPLFGNYLLGTRVRVDWISQNCELEISGPLLTIDRRIMNRSDVYVILKRD